MHRRSVALAVWLTTALACLGCDARAEPDAGGAPDAGAAPDGGARGGVDCATYCRMMEETCPRDMLQPREACEHVCAHPTVEIFDAPGTVEDTAGNTLGCRIHHLELAAAASGAERDARCAAANLSGGDTCGSYCDNYCLTVMNACTSANPAYGGAPVFASTEACRAACAAFPTGVLAGVAQPEQLFGYGDTVQCRLHHTHAAMEQDGYGLHCPHASATSTSETCDDAAQPNLPNYCAFATAFCPDLFPPGTDVGGCMRAVGAEVTSGTYTEGPFSSFTDTEGASLGCLNHWIVQAAWDASNCARADWRPSEWESRGGSGVCDP